MRQLHPVPLDDVDPLALYLQDARRPQPGRAWVLLNMVTTLDGAIEIDGVSGAIGGAADRVVFLGLRTVADVILVGAGTARAENYGPPRVGQSDADRREANGQPRAPRLVVISGRLDLDPQARLFSDPDQRPLVITSERADPTRRAELASVAEVVAIGEDRVDVDAAIDHLGTIGTGVVLCEGGPTLNGQLLARDLVDELCLTVTPLLVGGSSSRVAHTPASIPTRTMRLDRLIETDGELLLRYVRA